MKKMVAGFLSLAIAPLWAQIPRQPKPSNDPLSNAFVTSAESVIDDVDAVDLAAAPAAIDARMQTVKTAQANLAAMVVTGHEKDVKTALDRTIFALSACRIQAADGTDTTKCMSTLNSSREEAMDVLGRHKSGGEWTVGPVAAAAISAPPPADTAASASKPPADWPNLHRYAEENLAIPVAQPGRVVFYGDSITDAWPRVTAFFPGRPYLDRGISGQTTPQMLVRFRQDVVNLHPAVVVILAGTNDIAGNTGPETLEQIEDNFRSMAEIAKANRVRVVLASVLPTLDYPWRRGLEPSPRILALNQWLMQFSTEQGFVYLDYYNAMAAPSGATKPELTQDGVHPNAAGYAVMAPLAEAAVARALSQPVN